jgi:hypothetical protein
VHQALTRALEQSASFRARCLEAAGRGLAMRQRCPPEPGSGNDLSSLLHSEVRPLEAELARRLPSA